MQNMDTGFSCQTPLIRIIADDREQRSGTIEALKVLEDVEVFVQRLALGDYEVEGNFLFERKTLLDFTVSIQNGRLFDQACRLASSPKRPVLILEGTAGDLATSGMRREAIQGALITISLFLGIPVLRSQSPKESAQLICYAAKQMRRISVGALPHKGKRPKGKHRTQLQILQGLPGIGPAKAGRLLKTFGSVENAISARLEELKEVEGIGKMTAENIRWIVSEPESEYGFQNADLDL